MKNNYIEDDEKILIDLLNNMHAIIDKQDRDIAEGYSWYVNTSREIPLVYTIASKKSICMNRLIFMRISSIENDMMISFKNGNHLDHRRDNLIQVSRSDVQANRKLNVNSTSGVKGISWDKNKHRWVVRIQRHKVINKKTFTSHEEAVKWRNDQQ